MPFPLADFSIARLPRIEFGAGKIKGLPLLARSYGRHVLLLTGQQSFAESSHWPALKRGFEELDIALIHLRRESGEPTPEQVDEKVAALAGRPVDVVIGIGGGSVLDEAKAIAGLLKPGNSVMDHLEGVGPQLPYKGPATPFIAVPTTAGTGAEATKNAVLSRHGPEGFKKSFRDEQLVPEWALVDPDLLAGCPPEVIAGNGMDALTQLMESYVSLRANPFTDALALRGIKSVREGLLPLFDSTGRDGDARAHMALASLLSGICLAQTGLGSVHGLASPLGAFFPAPHGPVCGALLAPATRINIAALEKRGAGSPALVKYGEIGMVLADNPALSLPQSLARLVEILDMWSQRLGLPRLRLFGVAESDFERIIAHISPSSMGTNPVELTREELGQLLAESL